MWGCLFLYLAPFWNDSKEDKVWEANSPSTAIGSPRADGNRLWWARCSRHLCASTWRRSNHIRVFLGLRVDEKKQTFFAVNFAYLQALRIIKLQKKIIVSNPRPEIMRRSSSMYCSLKLFFGWLCYWSFAGCMMLNFPAAQVIRKKDEELFGAFGG